MTNRSHYTRRRVVQLSSAAAAVGLAGCSSGSTGESGSEPTDTSDGGNHSDTSGGEDHSDEDDGHDEGGDEQSDDGHDDGGHGDDGHGGVGDMTPTAGIEMVTTDDGGTHFEPHVARVETGGTVTWTLGSGSHNAAAYHPDNDQPRLVPEGAEAWDSGMLSEDGATFEHTFETEGVYHYYCAPHETGGMIGSVIVGEPDAHGQPALEDPPEDKPQAVREKITELNEMCNEALGHGHD
ncbi:plastocyanin/azurin family copper-binding protein [Halorubrum distributum]|uniref:plastocyanin/azurin family copper-binding protein n=1 Tax=Halorubrum distributum TaxID=29283 RepID=UPI0006776577